MTLLSHFFVAFGISFVGSIPFGMVNMTVAHTAIRKGLAHGLFMALGVSLVEFVQAYIAIKFTWLFNENPIIERVFQVVAAAVFLVGAAYFFFFAKATVKAADEGQALGRRRNDFLRGMFVSSLNLMIFPYWIFYAALLSANGWLISDDLHLFVFSAGTAVGTYALLVCYSLLGAKLLSKSEQVTRWINKFIGLVLLGFAVYQLYVLLVGGK